MSRLNQIAAMYHARTAQAMAGEAGVYKPIAGGETPVTGVIIDRTQLEPAHGGAIAIERIYARLSIADFPSINFGGDKLAIKKRKIDSATTDMTIGKPVSQDGGFWRCPLTG